MSVVLDTGPSSKDAEEPSLSWQRRREPATVLQVGETGRIRPHRPFVIHKAGLIISFIFTCLLFGLQGQVITLIMWRGYCACRGGGIGLVFYTSLPLHMEILQLLEQISLNIGYIWSILTSLYRGDTWFHHIHKWKIFNDNKYSILIFQNDINNILKPHFFSNTKLHKIIRLSELFPI